MFIVSVTFPYIGNKELAYNSTTFVVDAENEEGVIEEISKALPQKDSEVQEALCRVEGYKENEYYSIRIHEVPPTKKVVRIYDQNVGFNEPYKRIRI